MPHRRAAVAGRPPFHLPQRAPALGYFARRRCPGLRAQRGRASGSRKDAPDTIRGKAGHRVALERNAGIWSYRSKLEAYVRPKSTRNPTGAPQANQALACLHCS